ncbi:tRNA (adenosine(37)-N6)-threonylcarbamoyltransferase complex dimerization subunit type 1 TsaB [Ruania suaedae]|uniref:tRNA (adenosine(37)-N6)-threonylcarbamoyltransferase complex dimerization subunit type 1 TsaB n=1 Tax=Ruania suaedae TaxID=2897774 RepID=UPI001E58D830|nr:tRNA (adenosine(37)-N6)-threonylcarbamoyltransferase complex dimerization subunit type 1 TsaB [Ruania suaedae]UFU02366.1 tRNA (adenosine(37)-N6)-threonylcarbamoyltransferase complex dimerization subunit type 1 TsaB [Ruania suaedae]
MTPNSLLLCLDTSDGAAVAVLSAGRILAAARSDDPRRHVENLTPLIVGCLQSCGLEASDVSAIAVGTGPAPFTGLRVGLVTARLFAQAREVPVHGVSSLDAIAAAALEDAAGGAEVLVTTDARRREVYWGRYRREESAGVHIVAGPGVAAAAQVAADHEDLVRAGSVVGRGLALYPDELAAQVSDPARAGAAVVDPAWLGRLALQRAEAGVAQPTDALYLRRPDVHVAAGQPTGR